MSENDLEYRSSDDEDYVPEEGVEDVECSSGDEVEEVKEDDVVLKKRRKRAEREECSATASSSCANPSSTGDGSNEAEAAFMELMSGSDPILGKKRADVSVNSSDSAVSCGSLKEVASSTLPSSESVSSVPKTKDTAIVTEVFDFAGDEVRVQRVVSAEEAKEIESKERRKDNTKARKPSQKRTGLGGVLTLLAKKPKMSVLDKSNLDWSNFKAENNLQEELETYNRGKNGYLERLEFLSRSDYKEFEKEREVRNSLRKPI